MTTNTISRHDIHNALIEAIGSDRAGEILAIAASIVRDYFSQTEHLKMHLQRVARDTALALQTLDNGYEVNSMGIFGSSADDANRLAGMIQQTAEALNRQRYLLEVLTNVEFTTAQIAEALR